MKKLLKTKNFLIGFIMVMISIIPISNAKAYDEDIIKRVADWANEQMTNKAGVEIENAVVLYNNNDSTYYVPIKQTVYNNEMLQTLGWNTTYYSNHFILVSPAWYRLYLYKYNASSDSFTRVTATNWYTGTNSSIILDSTSYDFEIVYADKDITFGAWVSSGTYKGTTYYTGDIFYDSPEKTINITSTLATEILTGQDIYNIRVDFEQVYNATYTYQIKTDHTDWVDVTSNIADAVSYGYYHYDYTLRYNSNFYARALDSGGNVVTETSITISDLNDFGMLISKGHANDLQGRDVVAFSIDLRNCWEDNFIYQYSYDNVIFYNMTATSENRQFILNHGINADIYFRIIDSNNNVIYTLKEDKFTSYGEYYELYNVINRNVIVKETTNINDDNRKEIIISVDFSEFSQFSDMYNLKYYINNQLIDGDNTTLVYTAENFVTGFYIKVELDGIELKNYSHRIGTIGSGGGSDSGFNDIYDNVVDNNLNEELGEQDYSTVGGLFDIVKKFINAISSFVITFFDLIMYFFNSLNAWLRTGIISLFVVMVISKIIKVVRR